MRLSLIPDEKLGWLIRAVKRISNRKLGLNQPSASLNFLANNKKVLFAAVSYMAVLDRFDRLPRRLKRLVHLRVAMRVGCPS